MVSECRTPATALASGTAQLALSHFPHGTRVTRPTGGFVGWIELPRRIDAMALYARALEAGISVAPGPLFSAREKYRHFLRLNFAPRWDARRVDAVRRLGALAQAQASARAATGSA